MSNLNEFIARHPELTRTPLEKDEQKNLISEPIILEVIISHIFNDLVFVYHLGKLFTINKNDILEVNETSKIIFNPNPEGKGQAVELKVKNDTYIFSSGPINPSGLTNKLPFAISQPSLAGEINIPRYSANELSWLAKNNLNKTNPNDISSNSGTYCGHNTTSPKWSGTTSDGRQDDGHSDEYYGDDASHDDSGADD